MSTLRTARNGRVLTVTLDNPPSGFMTGAMVDELDALTRSLEGDRSIGAVVLTGAIEGLNALKRRCSVCLYTDSQYVVQGATEWLEGWKARGWKTASKQPVKNRDLWEKLDEAARQHEVRWQWVKGHADNEGNVRVDLLANLAIDALLARERGLKA